MTQLIGHWPNAAEASDDRSDAHAMVVPKVRTAVKLERVRVFGSYGAAMKSDANSVGEKLRTLKERTDLSLLNIAKLMGRPKSTVQRMFEPSYRPDGVLDLQDALEFASVFVGKGEPPVRTDEVMALTALPMVNESLGPQIPDIAQPVAEVMARAYAAVALQGRAPQPGAVEALARMIRELSLLHQRDPAMRGDPARTEGALQLLALQLSRTAPSSQ